MKVSVYLSTMALLLIVPFVWLKDSKRSRSPAGINDLDFEEILKKFEQSVKAVMSSEAEYIMISTQGKEAFVEPDLGVDRFRLTIGRQQFENSSHLDHFLALLCHEFGHIVKAEQGFVSNEEDADFWSTQTCLPAVFKSFDGKPEYQTSLDSEFTEACRKINPGEQQLQVCLRTLKAAYLFRSAGMIFDPTSTYPLTFSSELSELNCTLFKGAKGPSAGQCNFNHAVAGALGLPQPRCKVLLLMPPFYRPQNRESYRQEFEDHCREIDRHEEVDHVGS